MKTEDIPCRFVGEFKVGDNIRFNAYLLCQLLSSNESASFRKLVVLQAGAIVEASLDQIIYRTQNFNREGVPSLSADETKEIEGKKVEKFQVIIDVMRKYHMLDDLSDDIYEQLHKLRKYRNKVHIQNEIDIDGVSRDEGEAFSEQVRDWALGLVSSVVKYLDRKFPRPKQLEPFANTITLPVV